MSHIITKQKKTDLHYSQFYQGRVYSKGTGSAAGSANASNANAQNYGPSNSHSSHASSTSNVSLLNL